MGRTVRPDRVPPARQGHPAARLLRLEPAGGCARPDAPEGRLAGDHPSERLERGREDQTQHAGVRIRDQARGRPPHGRRQRVHRSPVTLDRAGDRALPREGQRLERHRLQLSDRPLRDGLRGPVRRHRPQCRRRARRGLQHRLGRRCGDGRVQLAFRLGEGAGLPREAAGVAPRSRARRSCEHAVVHLRRQRAVPGRPAGLPPHGLRSPGHRLHGLPGDRALQPADHDRRGSCVHRPAEALCARRHGSGARRRPVQSAALVSAAVDRRGLRLGRESPTRRRPDSARMSTGPGMRRWRRPGAIRTRSVPRTT